MTGCEIPAEATAIILQLKLDGVEEPTRVKIWSADGPEPAEGVLETADPAVLTRQGTAVVALTGDAQLDGRLLQRSTAPAAASGEVVGYFRALRAADSVGAGGGILYSTEGANNLF